MSDQTPPENHEDEPSQPEDKLPQFLSSATGRLISLRGLFERVVAQFELEHGEGESDAIKAATTPVQRRTMVRDVAEYVFGIESVQLSLKEQARIIGDAYAEIFGYGPLDTLLADERITTITLEGVENVAVRYGPAEELQPLEPIFEDTPHMRRIIGRLLRHGGAQLREDVPIIETGLLVDGRRVAVSTVTPPYAPVLAVDIRVHPQTLPTFDELVSTGFMNDSARDCLLAIAQSEHGFMIVGDTESSKTTLLSLMIEHINRDRLVTVERSGELALPDHVERITPHWPVDDDAGITFGEQIVASLDKNPGTLVLDEVRADEPQSIAPLLNTEDAPRQIWSFRGASEPSRIKSSLGMLARMADRTQPEHMVFNLYERLPFMILVKRYRGRLQLREIAEWQFPDGYREADDLIYADYVSLIALQEDDYQLTGVQPKHSLNLPDSFWG